MFTNSFYSLQNETQAQSVVSGSHYRFSILTSRLIRMEYSPEGHFEDRPTQTVFNRDFKQVNLKIKEQENSLDIITDHLHIRYDKQPFSFQGLTITLLHPPIQCKEFTWHYGQSPATLGGTARTLDKADGKIDLDDGIISRSGYTVLDDSNTCVINQDGWVQPRETKGIDLYFWGYGHDYSQALKDFFNLCGPLPLIPRYALGNWWSRFYPYTDKEYEQLMMRYESENIPFSVAVLDMDWHLVKEVEPQYGRGWTGYTWNRSLFPNPSAFLLFLHEHNLKVTLNVHPADGVRAFEEPYLQIAQEMGINIDTGEQVPFDIADPHFAKAYFNILHHPLEKQGVDFWWIDWQQGKSSSIPGLDPLWMLNHYHYLDNARQGNRPLILSRYAGIGSHRYPIGFSGDTVISWASLDFQPYFTATASNVGYGWWSHDIGGHFGGIRDDELATRWLQFGVFSPICRLHSSNDPFSSKEPWRFNPWSCQVMKSFLQLRHRLIPYLYSMNYRAHYNAQPLITPMYYQYPEADEAYEVQNQYWFGTEMIVAPITQKMDSEVLMGKTQVWLPDGIWIDFFTGRHYTGNRKLVMWRSLDKIPVLVKSGGIVPMMGESGNKTDCPDLIEIRVYPGADNTFALWEDDGLSINGEKSACITKLILSWTDNTFYIAAPEEAKSYLPQKRKWRISFCGFAQTNVSISIDNIITHVEYISETNTLVVETPYIDITTSFSLQLKTMEFAPNTVYTDMMNILTFSQIKTSDKKDVYKIIEKGSSVLNQLYEMISLPSLSEAVKQACTEILTADTTGV